MTGDFGMKHLLHISLLLTAGFCLATAQASAQKKKAEPCSPRAMPCTPRTADEINSFFGESDYPFRMWIRPKSKIWDGNTPLVVDVIFTNTTRESIFIDLKTRFQFNGYLDDSADKLGYRVVWRQEGKLFRAKREDYTEISPGKQVVFTLTSLEIENAPVIPNGERSWKKRRRGYYKFFVNYVSGGKESLFDGQWAGQAVSNTVRLYVK